MMRVDFLPLYDENGASSRLRVFTLHRELLKLGIDSQVGTLRSLGKGDVLVVQKHQSLLALALLKSHEGISIYDYDDTEVQGVLADIHPTIFTTDTNGHAEVGRAYSRTLHVSVKVVPDPIDFCPPAPLPPCEDAEGAVWFGHPSNLHAVTPLLERLGVAAMKWPGLDHFVIYLRQHSAAFLSHAGQDQGKSNNKAIAAIANGVPVVGHDSIAYRELLIACGLPHYYAHSLDEAKWGLYQLQHQGEREAYLKLAQPYVWEHFHPSVIAKRWLSMVEGLL